jgi:RNA ligase
MNSSKFAYVNDLQTFKAALVGKDEIRFMEQPNGTIVCCYMVSGPDTFNSLEALEARGIVFSADGRVIARPLSKFFNVNERPETQIAAIDWSKVSRVMLKRDGSMIHTVAFPEDGRNFTVKSKKSFESDVAKQSKKWLLQRENYIKFCTDMTEAGRTAIFEWTSPIARIVVGYKEDELQLLHVRDNTTGMYLTQGELDVLSAKYDIPLVDAVPFFTENVTQEVVRDLVEMTENIEGWVIQFQNGDMVKLKTKWYMDRHHATTFLRVRDIARMVVDETLDDLKAKLVGDGIDIAQINEIEQKVVREIDYIIERVEMTYEANKHLERKDFAILLKGHPHFNLLMQKFSGKEPDYKGFFAKTKLDEMFDLTQLNLTDSVAEVE